MKTLFAKILVWFLATTAAALLGLVAVSWYLGSGLIAQQPLLRALRFHSREAVHNYEEGGGEQLAQFLDRLQAAYDFRGVLADERGRGLSGPPDDFAPLVERARSRRVFADPGRGLLVFATPVDGRHDRYWFFLLVPRSRFGFWFRAHQYLNLPHLWLLACITLLSYALARHLTKPLLELRAAAERFGQGDLRARVRSDRQDELGQLARTFDLMAGRIERSVTAQKQLLQDVSHELRSPLSRLGVAIELARSGSNTEQALDRVSREAERLNELVAELLAMTREEIHRAPVNVAALLGDVVDQVQIEAQARRCRLILEAAPDIVAPADARLLRRAVENVARNAINYTAPESEVRVAAHACDGQVEITIQDAGPGVPEDSLPRLFDPFYRVDRDRDRSTGGAGLGLSIARRAIELHGGKIVAENTHPGLRVTISLPRSN